MTEATYNSLPLTTEQRVELIKNQLANFETDKADMAAWIANLSDKQKAMHVAFWPEHALCICVDEQVHALAAYATQSVMKAAHLLSAMVLMSAASQSRLNMLQKL
jgi:hypothetical protein